MVTVGMQSPHNQIIHKPDKGRKLATQLIGVSAVKVRQPAAAYELRNATASAGLYFLERMPISICPRFLVPLRYGRKSGACWQDKKPPPQGLCPGAGFPYLQRRLA